MRIKNTYGAEFDRGLLYVACTRAMHRLTVIGVGELAEFGDRGK